MSRNNFTALPLEILAEQTAIETLKMFNNSDITGDITDLKVSFIKYLTHLLIMEVLVSVPETLSKKEQFEQTHRGYASIKAAVQNGISDAFTLTFSRYASQTVDYYCQIDPVKPPVNKLPC